MAIASAILILLLATPAVYAAQHVVGGSSGWTNSGVDFSTWASGETFTVGDTVVFNYDSNTHQVAQVSQSDYSSCAASNAIKTYNDGATTISLTKAGSLYFICPTPGHCSGGMKVAINVVEASTAPSTTPTTPSSPSGSTSPPPPSSLTTPSTTPSTKSPSSGAPNNKNNLMFGFLLVFGAILALIG